MKAHADGVVSSRGGAGARGGRILPHLLAQVPVSGSEVDNAEKSDKAGLWKSIRAWFRQTWQRICQWLNDKCYGKDKRGQNPLPGKEPGDFVPAQAVVQGVRPQVTPGHQGVASEQTRCS